MTSRGLVHPGGIVACSMLLLSGCAQGSFGVSPSTVLSTVIMAGEVLGSRTTSSGSRTTSSTRAGSTARYPRSPAPSATVSRVLGTADEYVGVRYKWGGTTPDGFDCSGFTRFVFARHGIQLPRTSREQARAGQPVRVDPDALLPGDLLLFAEPGAAISHVAIYVGNGEIIHASSSYGAVNYLDLGTSRGAWFVQNMVAARRLTSNGRSLVQGLRYLTIPGLPLDPPDRAPAPR